MFGISFEHILIVGVILLIMGPKRLPELGNTMGKAIKNFKDSIAGIEEANFKRVTENKAPTSAPAVVVTAETVTASAAPIAPTAAATVSNEQTHV